MIRHRSSAAVAAFLLGVATLAVTARGEEIPRLPENLAEAPGDGKNAPGLVALSLARQAAEAGRDREAATHYTRAISELHDPVPALREVLELSGADPDARVLWAHALVASVADAAGKAKLAREVEGLLPEDDPHLQAVSRARAAAATELAKLAATLRAKAKKVGGTTAGARFAADLAAEVMLVSPALVEATAPAVNAACAGWKAQHRPVISALESLMNEALGKKQTGVAIEAARILQGLVSQTGFDDLEGPEAPGLGRLGTTARRGLDRAREQLAGKEDGAPLTLSELEAMTAEESEAFTRDHASPARPGLALSPGGLYRLETICGYETLAGATATVEQHHARLVDFFGKDPFAGRPGIVRILPEHSGLEAEGAPFWWAGGFQSGDVTTVHFAVSNIEGLGRTLTHELTHRFDGVIYPGLPGWLIEGRAVWTGAAYGSSIDTAFVDRHVRIGTVENAFIKGYGGRENLEKLIAGTIDDYRDNYVAGYALWVYLRFWMKDGRPLYAAPLEAYMRGIARGRSKPVSFFEACFADGKAGRPAKMEEFARKWRAFLKGFHWQSRAPWVNTMFTTRTPRGARAPWVQDPPTWNTERSRAEPWFGQDQARAAGDLLLANGRRAEAALAYAWSLEVDEWSPRVTGILAQLLEESGHDELAWVLRAELAWRSPGAAGGGAGAEVGLEPPPPALTRGLSDTLAYLDTLAAAAADYTARERLIAAAALAADHDRIAVRVGRAPLSMRAPATRVQDCLHPLDEPGTPVGLWGYVEDKLSGYDERRRPDLWYVNDDGDLIVGRARPLEGTGAGERGLFRRDAYARGREWIAPGRYLLRTRVYLETSFVAGAIVLGSTRRDRNLRFRFSAGDYMYSAGEKDEAAKLDSISWSIQGLRPRDGGLAGSAPGSRYEFGEERGSFRLDLLVDGPELHVFIENEWVGAYHTIDGAPIEGAVGCATSWGAVRIENPTLRRLDRTSASGLERVWPQGLRPDLATSLTGGKLANRHVRGFPLGERGTLVVWLPDGLEEVQAAESPEAFSMLALDAAAQALQQLETDRLSLQLDIAVPAAIGEVEFENLKRELDTLTGGRAHLLVHHHTTSPYPLGADENLFFERPVVLFIDPAGVLRLLGHIFPGQEHLNPPMLHWATILK